MVKQFQQSRGGFRGRGQGGRGGGRGGFGRSQDQGPPSYVIPYGTYMHRSQNNFVLKCTDMTRFPKFNRAVFLENKAKVGTIDQIFGPLNAFYFSVKPSDGVDPKDFKEGQVFYMSPEDLLSTDKFTKPQGPRPKGQGGPRGRPQGGRPGGFQGRPQGGFGGRPQGGFQGRPQGQGNFGNQRGRAPFQKR